MFCTSVSRRRLYAARTRSANTSGSSAANKTRIRGRVVVVVAVEEEEEEVAVSSVSSVLEARRTVYSKASLSYASTVQDTHASS